MIRSAAYIRSALLLVILLLASVALPYAVHAHYVSDELRTTIQNELLSDPRTSGFSHEQIDAIVDVLAAEALKSGLTSGDIIWQPQDADTFAASNSVVGEASGASACDSSGVLCLFNEAFGLVGPDTTIPFILGASSMALVWIFAEMLHRRRMRMQQNIPTSM